jgi:hypothetical protein
VSGPEGRAIVRFLDNPWFAPGDLGPRPGELAKLLFDLLYDVIIQCGVSAAPSEIRALAGLSPADVADLVGLQTDDVTGIEHGNLFEPVEGYVQVVLAGLLDLVREIVTNNELIPPASYRTRDQWWSEW